MTPYLILGCGFTAIRVARHLLASGSKVICTNRKQAELTGATCVSLDTQDEKSVAELKEHLSAGMTVLHSIPEPSHTPMLLDALRPFYPKRVVYLSTTGVYGSASFVDETTAAAPETERDAERLRTEQLISTGSWSSLVLRPAAIYGPYRGVHTSARSGIFRPPPGGNRIVSRIHVDDLAAHVLAGLQGEITGTLPIADEEPATSLEVAEWTCAYLKVPLTLAEQQPLERRRDAGKKGRRVDGSAYRRRLGLTLRYPSFRQGVPASLAAEGAAEQIG